ncbi:MAG: secretin N-terminal domain-containing protein [Chthoniobacterales bacterium]
MLRPLCLAAFLSLAAAGSFFAQAPVPPPPPPPAPVTAAGTGVPTGSDMVSLQYPNSDVQDILRLYEQLTGLKLIMDNQIQGKVNISISKPIPREDAIKIIEINLLMNKFALVPAGDGLVKVLSGGQNPRTAGVPIISDEALIPPGEHVISFLFRLRFADPTEIQQVLIQYLQPPQAYTSALPLPKAGSILVTENSAVIRSLVSIINQVDIPPAEVVSEFIRLERADASKVVDMLKEVFDRGNQPNNGIPGAGGVRAIRPQPNVPAVAQQQVYEGGDLGALTALSEESVVVGKIKMSADVRTNRIHVITRPINMPFVRRLIGEFDANVEFAKPVTRPLRYISAADVLPVIVQTLSEPGETEGGGGAGANPNTPPGQQQQQQQRRNPSNTASTTSDFGNSNSGGGGGQSFSEELSTQSVDTTPKAVTIGNAKIIADQRANTIIILGNREVVVKVQKLLDEMDVSAPQVALSTVIGELSLNNDENFGVDWFLRQANRRAGVSNNTGARLPGGTGLFNPGRLSEPFTQLATAAAGGANVYLAAGNTLATIVTALESSGRFRTISRPTVFTSNNKKAIIASGTEIPVPVNTISGAAGVVGGLAQQSNIQFKKVALQLEVVPLINSEKEVSLDILQKLDSVAQTVQIDNNQIPTIATRYIKTTVSAPNCSTVVLGGLITERTDRGQSGIPVLSRIPVVGGLFRNTTKTKNRQELVILMRPEVTMTKADISRIRQKTESKTHFGAEIDQDDCPDCPRVQDSKDLPAPDLPALPGK